MSEEDKNKKQDKPLKTPGDLFGRVTEKARVKITDQEQEQGEEEKKEENNNKTIH